MQQKTPTMNPPNSAAETPAKPSRDSPPPHASASTSRSSAKDRNSSKLQPPFSAAARRTKRPDYPAMTSRMAFMTIIRLVVLDVVARVFDLDERAARRLGGQLLEPSSTAVSVAAW